MLVRLLFFFLSFVCDCPFHIFVCKVALTAIVLVAVTLLQLYYCLRVGCTLYLDAPLYPAAYDAVLLALQGVHKVLGFAAQNLVVPMLAVGIHHRYYSVYYKQVQL